MGKRLFIIIILLGEISSSRTASAQFTLGDAQQYALFHNKDLQATNLAVKQAESELFNAGLLTPFNPEVELEKDSDILTSRSGEGSFQLSLNQEIEIGGQRGRRLDAARGRVERAQADALAFQQRLLSDVRYAHAALLVAQMRTENAKYTEELSRALKDTALVRYRNGFLPFSEYTFLNLDYVSTVKARSEAEAALNGAQNQLAFLLGLPERDSIRASGDLSIRVLSISEEELVSLANKSRYELIENSLDRNIAGSELALARLQRIPNLKLSAFYLRDKSVFNRDNLRGNVPGFEGLKDTDHLFGLRIGIPLPLINRRRSEITSFRVQAEIIDTLRQGLALQIISEVRTAYQNLKLAQNNLELIARVLPDADSVFSLLEVAYSEGRIKLDNYLFQKDRLLLIRSDFIDAYREYAKAIRSLEQAVGLEWDSIH
jgi:cobalt-zinc-cadmium efflux system outer membrane protein